VSLSGNPSLLRVMIVRDPCLVNEKSVINKYGRWKKWIINNKKKPERKKILGARSVQRGLFVILNREKKMNESTKSTLISTVQPSGEYIYLYLLKKRAFVDIWRWCLLFYTASVYFYTIVTAAVYRKKRLYIIIYALLFLYILILQGSIKNQSSWEKNKLVDSHGRAASGNGFITYFICTLGSPLGADEYRKSENNKKKIA